MEPRRDTITNTLHFSKKLHKIILLILILPFAAILFALLFRNSSNQQPLILHSFINKACSETFYTALCHSTLSNINASSNNFTITYFKIIEFAINRTAEHVKGTRTRILTHFKNQELNLQEKNALQDCMEMLDQTTYELQQAIENLQSFPLQRSYGNIKTLLSAAMTNENTCINGFLDLEELDLGTSRKGHREHLQNLLTPISRMISNSLALIKHVENKNGQEIVKKPRIALGNRRTRKASGYVTVSSDGKGNYTSIGEAIEMAPRMSMSIYVIKINAGIYKENVLIPREKINVMLIGDGMNSTIITGSRNFADGYSTFASATMSKLHVLPLCSCGGGQILGQGFNNQKHCRSRKAPGSGSESYFKRGLLSL